MPRFRRPRPSLTLKLFAALLIMAVAVAFAMSVAARLSLTRGFLGYLNDVGLARVDELVPRFAQAYARHGSWEFLHDSRKAWFRLIGPEAPPGAPPLPEEILPELTGANFRLSLLDPQRHTIAGFPEVDPDRALSRPIVVDQRVVGYLTLMPFQQLTEAAGLRFVQRQQQALLVVAALAMGLAGLSAMLLARRLLRPVRGLRASTRQLADGDYAARVQVDSGDELGQLAEDFNRMADALQRNEAARRALMADVSHELRTPLAILKGEIEALQDGLRPLDGTALSSLQAEVETLNKLVGDIYELSLADVGALSFHFAEVDLHALLQTLALAYGPRLAQRGIALTLELPQTPTEVHADEARLRQLFSNLLENSLRYTRTNGQLRLQLLATPTAWRIRVEDSGPGVPASEHAQLFDRFYRRETSRNRASGGAGLGLAICRSIAQAHGGSIHAATSALGGLAIVLELPLAEQGAQRAV